MVLELELLELAKKALAAVGYGNVVLTQMDTTEAAKTTELAVRVAKVPTEEPVIPTVFLGHLGDPEVTYDVEVWLFDYGKKGITKIIKKIPRCGSEEEREKNRARAQDALFGAYQEKLCAAM